MARYLNVLFQYCLIDGTMSARDLVHMMPDQIHGFAIDLSRNDIDKFDYSLLESLKNEYLMSGKYHGMMKRFKVGPVVVFANSTPKFEKLSLDRWDVVQLG